MKIRKLDRFDCLSIICVGCDLLIDFIYKIIILDNFWFFRQLFENIRLNIELLNIWFRAQMEILIANSLR